MTPLPQGFSAAGCSASIKKDGSRDLGILLAAEAFPAHALFTRNHLLGCHIQVSREHLRQSGGRVRALLVNAGNANCATGNQGLRDCKDVAAAVAKELGCPIEQVLFWSTGVIGAALPKEKILAQVPGLVADARSDGAADFADAIRTTDLYPKLATTEFTGDEGDSLRITGIAKGSGMIHPDMATMLAFLLTDARSASDMRLNLRHTNAQSFARLTVDGDTSPNDSVILWSSEQHWSRPVEAADGVTDDPFLDQLSDVAMELCQHIAADGEGATRLVTIRIAGALSESDIGVAARAVGQSLLVKTAIHGHDPNWGRIVSAVCSSGAQVDIDNLQVQIGGHTLFAGGEPKPANEPAAATYLREQEAVLLEVHLGVGPYSGDGWSCDLSGDYVKINADYRT